MEQTRRREYIINKLKKNKKVKINELSEELKVSNMTIRRDLKYLNSFGIINFVSKGAILNTFRDFDLIDDSLKTRNLQNIKEKKIIAEFASSYINDGDVIFLDASTTVYEMCPHLIYKKITILTNSIRIAQYFSTTKNITVILSGGLLRYATLSLVGIDSEEMLNKYNPTKMFMSSKAISLDAGVTDVNIFEINTKKSILKNSLEVILLLDSSKINKISLRRVCEIKNISKLIINNSEIFTKKDLELLEEIKKMGVEVYMI